MKLFKTNVQKVKKFKDKNKQSSGKFFEIIDNGLDVKMLRPINNKWEGMKFSDMRDDPEGRRLLAWFIEKEFVPEEVREIAEELINGL